MSRLEIQLEDTGSAFSMYRPVIRRLQVTDEIEFTLQNVVQTHP